ncbi:BTB/POZ domain-containing protein [Heracleum sosnowskyi]|uniref:BTB/POZ domain-containing protein n=1 Tax=Heracleum sosnowskyi TaxID=360622 RepID=A0AAD8LY98_9APIA|nr:BTB/POZ domain-containing protein [Heracleum sosnowskyi]
MLRPRSVGPLILIFIQGFGNALKWVKKMTEVEEELNEKLRFLGGFISAFKDHIHTDIYVKPGDFGPSIPAHRALLASRSSIFKNMLESDSYITADHPPGGTITLAELYYEELQCLLEFLYNGNLSKEKVEKHVYSLSIAADKYEIPYLQKFCENQMRRCLNLSNVLDVLEISDTCSNLILREEALNFIVRNMGEIIFLPSFEEFALKNPHLNVQITRASFLENKNTRNVI